MKATVSILAACRKVLGSVTGTTGEDRRSNGRPLSSLSRTLLNDFRMSSELCRIFRLNLGLLRSVKDDISSNDVDHYGAYIWTRSDQERSNGLSRSETSIVGE